MLFEISMGVFFVLIPEYSILNSPDIGLRDSFAAIDSEPGYPLWPSFEIIENTIELLDTDVSQLTA